MVERSLLTMLWQVAKGLVFEPVIERDEDGDPVIRYSSAAAAAAARTVPGGNPCCDRR